jgi:hypothetical protein
MKAKNGVFQYEYQGVGLSTAKKNIATKKFDDYKTIYPHLNKLSDLQLLEELVYLEMMLDDLKEKISKLTRKKSTGEEISSAVPDWAQKQVKDNLDQIIKLKEKLGLFEEKKDLGVFQWITEILKKAKKWRELNQGSRICVCPFCRETFVLMIRTDKYEAKKFPFFKDKVLCNPHLHKLWKAERITSEEYAEIIGTSPDFPQWLEEKHFKSVVKEINQDNG